MSQNISSTRSQVTRQDRAVNDDTWIAGFLQHAPMATIATVQSDQPFLSTMLFVLDETKRAIYFHTAQRGRLWENLKRSPRACLTATQMGRLLPAKTAFNFSVEYQSVVVFGDAHLVNDPVDAERALQMILDKYFAHLQPGRDYRSITASELALTAVFRLDIEEWSGKRKAVDPDFPGAFTWDERP